MKKCVVVYNPNSGRGIIEKYISKIQKIIEEFNLEATIIKSEYAGHTKKIIEKLDDCDLLISMGGDGTFNEAMSGNLKREKPLLISHIPVGTANDIGAMYGYKKNHLVNNLKTLLNGTIKEIDICKINDQVFTYSAGIGKFTNIANDTPERLKKRLGYLAYIIECFKDLMGDNVPLYNLTYEINGEVYKGKYSFLLISNSSRIGGINNFYKEVKLDDNQFEVLLCDITDRKQIIKSLMLLATSDITKAPGFKYYKTNNFKINFEKDSIKDWTVDGEKYSSRLNKFNIDIIRNVKILIPNKNIDKLFLKKEGKKL